jgi:hypothetical protein
MSLSPISVTKFVFLVLLSDLENCQTIRPDYVALAGHLTNGPVLLLEEVAIH